MKDYTIARLCEIYRKDVWEFVILQEAFDFQSTLLGETAIYEGYKSIFINLTENELKKFHSTTAKYLEGMGYLLENPDIESNSINEVQKRINGELHVFDKIGTGVLDMRKIVYSSTPEYRTTMMQSKSPENYPYAIGVFEYSWDYKDVAHVINNIRNFYQSDFYLNVFTPELDALKLEWLIPEKKKPNNKSKI